MMESQESQEFQMSDRTIDSSWEPLRPTYSKLKHYFIVFAQNFSSSTLKIIFLLCNELHQNGVLFKFIKVDSFTLLIFGASFSFLPLRKIKNKGSVSGHTHGSTGPLLLFFLRTFSIY